MVKKTRGFRARTRSSLSQKPGYRPTITKFLKEFTVGQDVVIIPETSSHKGMPFPRFRGKAGKITGRRGNAYLIEVRDGNATKTVISRPEHLKAL